MKNEDFYSKSKALVDGYGWSKDLLEDDVLGGVIHPFSVLENKIIDNISFGYFSNLPSFRGVLNLDISEKNYIIYFIGDIEKPCINGDLLDILHTPIISVNYLRTDDKINCCKAELTLGTIKGVVELRLISVSGAFSTPEMVLQERRGVLEDMLKRRLSEANYRLRSLLETN